MTNQWLQFIDVAMCFLGCCYFFLPKECVEKEGIDWLLEFWLVH